MKRFFRFVMEWKTGACLMFTGTMVLYLVICQILGEQAAPVGTLWSLLLVSAAGTLLQVLCFTELVIRRMRYTTRLACSACCFCRYWRPSPGPSGGFPWNREAGWYFWASFWRCSW